MRTRARLPEHTFANAQAIISNMQDHTHSFCDKTTADKAKQETENQICKEEK